MFGNLKICSKMIAIAGGIATAAVITAGAIMLSGCQGGIDPAIEPVQEYNDQIVVNADAPEKQTDGFSETTHNTQSDNDDKPDGKAIDVPVDNQGTFAIPVERSEMADNPVFVDEGYGYSLKDDGSLWGWGSMFTHMEGGSSYLSPIEIMDSVASVFLGISHSMALKTDGSLWSWGRNWGGELGDGTMTDRLSPVKIMDSVGIPGGGSISP